MFTANPEMTEDKIVNDLRALFGKEFTYADVKVIAVLMEFLNPLF